MQATRSLWPRPFSTPRRPDRFDAPARVWRRVARRGQNVPMDNLVQVVFLKYDGRPHRSYPARLLGEDDAGTWLGVTSGTAARVGGEKVAVREEPYVLLVPRHAWWTAMFNAAPRRTEVYCDITTPATWMGQREVTVVDLDLYVRRRRWGVIERLYQEEFAEHQVEF